MNEFLKLFTLGIRTWFEACRFIFRNGLVHYFIYPVLLSILLGMGAMALIRQAVRWIMDLITPSIEYNAMPDDGWWNRVLEVMSNIGEYAIAFVLWIIGFYTFSKISKYLILALMSPVMALLSEKTESILTGKNYPFDGGQLVRDIVRGIALAVRNFCVEIFLTVVVLWGINLLITLFFPPLGVILSPLFALASFLVGAYFFGFSTLDYYNERKRLSFRESIQSIREKKGLAVGNGTMFSLFFMIPFIGITITTITCTVAATLAMHRISKL